MSGAFFAAEADRVARLCHRMAERFARGGRLLAVGQAPAARSDARHVAVEFVHPVIVGKRALPALAITSEAEAAVRLLAEPDDMLIAFEPTEAVAAARAAGALTIGFDGEADWDFALPGDPYERQETAETLYHVLWELVHVFFEHAGGGEGAGASSFLYPFLEERETDVEAVIADVARSMLMKQAEAAELRTETLRDNAAELERGAALLRRGGRLLAIGNGGSATDAMDLVADARAAGLRALDLTEDTAVITAVANDVGVEAVFSRQVIAHGRPDDTLVAFSTSGGSANVLHALDTARRRGLGTIAFVGYDGGRILAERLADAVIVTHSEHIPRIQEAQASAYHDLLARCG